MSTKIIIRTPNHLGDCVMALPMINDVGEAYPAAAVTVLVPDNLADLFSGNPGLDQVLKIPSGHVHGLLAVMKIKEIIASDQYDVGYILPPSFGAAASFKLAGVKERIGYVADGRRLLLTRPLPLPTPMHSAHRYELYYNLLRRTTDLDMELARPKLFLNDDDVVHGTSILSGFDFHEYDEYMVVAFRAVAESRRWGSDKYTELIRMIIAEHHLRVVLVGTSDDMSEGDQIVEAVEHSDMVINLAGKTSLRELAAILSRARLFVGNDSGPAHLAGAVGAPVVVLSGADDPRQTSPVAANKRMLFLDNLDCISCVKNKCPEKGDSFMRCMKDISVEAVADQVAAIVAGE